MEDPAAARGLRPRRRAAQVRRAEPRRRPRRRAGDHVLHGAARHAGRVRRRPAREQPGDGRDRQDGAGREGQQGHRPAAEPPRPARGRPVRRRRQPLPRRPSERAGRRGHRLRRAHRARRGRPPAPHRAGLHPGDRVGRRRPRGQLVQRQRRRCGQRGGARARRVQGPVPHRRARLAARPGRSRVVDQRGDRRRGPGGDGDDRAAACGPKLQACLDAIHGGVGNAYIIDGRLPHSLLLELFTDAGTGTKIGPSR